MKGFDNIPEELRRLPRWVCWKMAERNGKPTKIPINPISGNNAQSNNPATWSDYWTALDSMTTNGFSGIGFMFNGEGIVGVDIDHCRDPDTGAVTELAKDIIQVLNSYTEISQSGTGIHIICRGQLPEGKRRKEPVEVYEVGRYFAMTGNVLDDAHMEVEERTAELTEIHKKYVDVDKKIKNTSNKAAQICQPNNTSDDDIIEIALKAKNGDLFAGLMNGSWQGTYGSQSEADLALCNLLAFYTGNDASMMDRIFHRSGLYRDKWNEKRGEGGTYGEITINRAAADCVKTYQQPRPKKESSPVTEDPDINTGFQQLGKDAPAPQQKFDIASDLGRSKKFSSRYAGELYWCQDVKTWYLWNGKYWEDDRKLSIYQMAKEVVEEMVNEAAEVQRKAGTPEAQAAANKLFKDAAKGRSEKAIKAMLELAKGDLPIVSDEFDANPFLLNCQNGIVDLRTGQLMPHDSGYNMSKIAAADYVPGKKFELFESFLKLIACDDAELVSYLRDVCGMAAIGKVYHEGMCMFYGTGQNGKSTFLNAISKVYGDYAYSINPEMLMVQKDGKQPLGIVQISGRRFVTAMETEEGRRLSGAMLKKLASTDPITGRDLYQKDRTFLPSHTLIMATNFLPKVSSSDVGTWRRILLVPFRASIQSVNQIKDYANVLFERDGDAILSWVIEGAVKYFASGQKINVPKAVNDATRQYRESEDWIGNFVYECCEVGNFEEQGGKLYDAYVEWCDKNNETYKRRPRDFASTLEIAGYEKRRTMHGAIWQGLKLIPQAEQYSNKYKTVKKYEQKTAFDDDELDEIARKGM
jgi:putative DNA primase/helicase